MFEFLKRKQLTMKPDGSRPSYDDLEASLIKKHDDYEALNLSYKYLNKLCAELRYELDKYAKINKKD